MTSILCSTLQGFTECCGTLIGSHCQEHPGKPLLLIAISVSGCFHVHYTIHRTYGFMSHPEDEVIMVKCLPLGPSVKIGTKTHSAEQKHQV